MQGLIFAALAAGAYSVPAAAVSAGATSLKTGHYKNDSRGGRSFDRQAGGNQTGTTITSSARVSHPRFLRVGLSSQTTPNSSTASTNNLRTTTHKRKTSHTAGHSSTPAPTASTTKTATASTATKPAAKSARGKASSRRKTKKVKGQEAPTPDRINEIQEALATKGAFSGTPTGKWDADTVDAMKKFQAGQGLSPTGKLDALTLQKLGLGSQTAGLAAPTPPPKSMNRLRNTTSTPAVEPPVDEPRNR